MNSERLNIPVQYTEYNGVKSWWMVTPTLRETRAGEFIEVIEMKGAKVIAQGMLGVRDGKPDSGDVGVLGVIETPKWWVLVSEMHDGLSRHPMDDWKKFIKEKNKQLKDLGYNGDPDYPDILFAHVYRKHIAPDLQIWSHELGKALQGTSESLQITEDFYTEDYPLLTSIARLAMENLYRRELINWNECVSRLGIKGDFEPWWMNSVSSRCLTIIDKAPHRSLERQRVGVIGLIQSNADTETQVENNLSTWRPTNDLNQIIEEFAQSLGLNEVQLLDLYRRRTSLYLTFTRQNVYSENQLPLAFSKAMADVRPAQFIPWENVIQRAMTDGFVYSSRDPGNRKRYDGFLGDLNSRFEKPTDDFSKIELRLEYN